MTINSSWLVIASVKPLFCSHTSQGLGFASERKAMRDELELLKRRIFIAKAERVDSKQLELEFFNKLSELNELEKELATELNPEPAQGANEQNGG